MNHEEQSTPTANAERVTATEVRTHQALAAAPFSLDDDTPLTCSRDQSGDTTCESCQ